MTMKKFIVKWKNSTSVIKWTSYKLNIHENVLYFRGSKSYFLYSVNVITFLCLNIRISDNFSVVYEKYEIK